MPPHITTNHPSQARRMANALRMLSIDAVERARSGHPGAPMGMADMAQVLWHQHLRHNPANPHWPDRDRFVLSNGHASMLLYALLHLSGYDLPLDELKNFRQLGSQTPGHPEVGHTPGVETTTGPLGQGLANAVGMALAEKLLAAQFNRPEHRIVDHYTYALVGDGCLMEGLSQEAISLAGTLRLSKLIVLYDDNGISIDGPVQDWFADDTPARFAACGWYVLPAVNGHDSAAIDTALQLARAQAALPDGQPTLICCRTEIGHGSPAKANSADVHGAPLGSAEVAATRAALGWSDAPFDIPTDIAQAWDARAAGAQQEADWQQRLARYRQHYPTEAAEFTRRMAGDLPAALAAALPQLYATVAQRQAPVATRKASQQALDLLAPLLPELFGGSADLTGSNLTDFQGHRRAGRDQPGNHLSWGVREFGMAAMMNGMALHGGLIPYGGTFLTFSDYSRNAIRMAALMRQRVIHVFTHDSIGLGEDGPTHQPIEHIPSLRLIPHLDVWRPADALETLVAWTHALQRADGPSALCLSRQNLPAVSQQHSASAIAQGGYILSEAKNPAAVIIATGSEVEIALVAQQLLAADGLAVRVVSMPCTNVFDRQSAAYQNTVLPLALPTLAVEAAQPDFWRKYVGRTGMVVGLTDFGQSAPAAQLYQHYGITAERIAAGARTLIHRASARAEIPLPEHIVKSDG